ncbi:chromosome partitioning protein ParB [Leptospira alexanderi]|uniref:chromosome partitioning protein ParB n=1 Tax=Leptospira alexanderi TaxID=100053 RepID=UPI000990C5C8|nr:chromosome partitioning protein ParB [Leptospira alexanderi]
MKVEGNTKGPKKDTSTKVSLEEKAKEWMDAQESSPRPGSTYKKQYIPKGVTLNPIVKMVNPESLKPNPRNDFDPLTKEEYESLKENIALNGILDALTARKDGTLVTGENRYRIALELKDHEDENVRRRVENIPVRYYMNELTQEEYDILEGDNLFRRHLTAEQRKERLKRRILRKYKDELVQDNRGGNRKSESSKILSEEETNGERSSFMEKQRDGSPESELGLFFGEVGALEKQEKESNLHGEGLKIGSDQKSNDHPDRLIGNSSKGLVKKESSFDGTKTEGSKQGKEGSKIHPESLKIGSEEKSNDQGDRLIGKSVELAKKVSENENIPFGTAKRYVSELRKELKTKEPKQTAKKEKAAQKEEVKKSPRQVLQSKVKEFQKKYGKMSYTQKEVALERLLNSLRKLRKQQADLHKKTMELGSKDSELVELLTSVGQQKRIWKMKV